MERKKGRLNLLEALEFLDDTAPVSEATVSRGYPDDGTGVAGDDDRPPGNIVYGEKYKKVPYFNRLTDFQKRWGVDLSDWSWDEFEHSMGMEDFENYSDTLQSLKELFPEEVWRRVWAKMKNVPDALTTKRFKDAGQPWRKGGEDQMSDLDGEPHADVDVDRKGSVKADIKKESLERKIDNLII